MENHLQEQTLIKRKSVCMEVRGGVGWLRGFDA